MNVLVTGGAGYVGSHTVRRLVAAGHRPVILDNLFRGHAKVAEILGVPLVVAEIGDRSLVGRALEEHRIEAVMHFAAFAYVGESNERPLSYYWNNVGLTVALLETMAGHGVERLIFSSTCAIYGTPRSLPINETERKAPMSPYGRSKLAVEQILADHLKSRPAFSYAALRYFNAAGAAMDGSLGEDHSPETHLIPLVLRAIRDPRSPLTVFGTDYPTADGTAVRDYIHVDDLADAHVQALDRLAPGTAIECNLGTGKGHSVKEIIDIAERVTGQKASVVWGPRRPGDPPDLYADAQLAERLLGWKAQHPAADEIIGSAWRWMSEHPNGYARGQ
jgi:UDP-glucose 4-epimerase